MVLYSRESTVAVPHATLRFAGAILRLWRFAGEDAYATEIFTGLDVTPFTVIVTSTSPAPCSDKGNWTFT